MTFSCYHAALSAAEIGNLTRFGPGPPIPGLSLPCRRLVQFDKSTIATHVASDIPVLGD